MKKILLIFSLVIAVAFTVDATYKAGYYNAMNGKKKEALKAAAKQCVQSHTQLNYSDLPVYWQYTDIYPDLYNGCKRWWDMYSNNMYLIQNNQSPKTSFSANKMQREHSVPKSWWKKDGDVEYTPAYSDMWNLYPSDASANQAKSNYPFGVTKSTTFNNGVTKVGPAATGYGGGSGIVFEPADEYKGDFARSIFYMATVYDDLPWVINYMFKQNTWPTLQEWAYEMLLQWARMDPVDQKEINRNDQVEIQQGNRNPFVDFPELAEYIWGTRTTEVFNINEQGGTTPPITGDPELSRPVNGSALNLGQTVVNQTVSMPLEIAGSNLTSALSLRISGTDRGMFYIPVSSISAATINTDGMYKLNVEYRPTAVGTHSANLSIYDGGLDISQNVAVTLMGEAFAVPTLSTLTATEATNVSKTSYVANWKESSDVVDYYIVTRVQYKSSGPVTTKITSDVNSVEIEDRDINVAESYTVQSYRLGYTSEPSNSINVAAGYDFVNTIGVQPLTIGEVPGGFVVMLDSEHTGLKVYDMLGRIVTSMDKVAGGETIYLPSGIYIVRTDQSGRPLKIVVR